jgi:hypothetical protein
MEKSEQRFVVKFSFPKALAIRKFTQFKRRTRLYDLFMGSNQKVACPLGDGRIFTRRPIQA